MGFSICQLFQGTYVCSKCDYELFPSTAKYEHSSPWPAFRHTVHADSLARLEERPGVFKIVCGKCGSPLGHEFVNDSDALKFIGKANTSATQCLIQYRG
uniref:Methionine sulfoxide reductase B1a n=1 Tax=Eptatretus burgeri TaxID=7764 RepID=A0A8C4N7H1_EPTBU